MDKPITKIELCLTSWTEHYPTGAVAYNGDEMIDSDYCDTVEEYKEFIDRIAPFCTPWTSVFASIDPEDIDTSNVIDVAKEVGKYAKEKFAEISKK